MAALSSAPVWAEAKAPAVLSGAAARQEITKIDAKINELEQKKKSVDAQAKRAGINGNRLQFQDFMTSRVYYTQQERLEAQSQEIQKRIDALQQRKSELQKFID